MREMTSSSTLGLNQTVKNSSSQSMKPYVVRALSILHASQITNPSDPRVLTLAWQLRKRNGK